MASQEPPLNQKNLSEQAGISRTTVGRLWHDDFSKIDVPTAEKLLNFFDCDLTDLFEVRQNQASEAGERL